MNASADAYDLTDALVAAVNERPGLTAAKLARRLKVDAGTVRQYLAYLARDHYVALTRRGGRDTYEPAAR